MGDDLRSNGATFFAFFSKIPSPRSGKSESEVARLSVCQLLDKRLQPRERISSIISDANERRERERERESEEEKAEKKENNRRRLNMAEVLGGRI